MVENISLNNKVLNIKSEITIIVIVSGNTETKKEKKP